MAKKEEFKEFVKKHPRLLKPVQNGETTWQKLYEIYDIYGEEGEAWNDYLKPKNEDRASNTEKAAVGAATGFGLAELVNVFKNLDLDSLQNGIGNIQRVLGVIQDFGRKDNTTDTKKTEYKPRPIYKHFED